ncbi:hypothetical protein ACIPTP_21735 [Pectobacterium versatile]|uniref:hypothetical protein n=1 Tax=Pectobacterium versatile TaxID=2488639 RepID=UPI00382137EC
MSKKELDGVFSPMNCNDEINTFRTLIKRQPILKKSGCQSVSIAPFLKIRNEKYFHDLSGRDGAPSKKSMIAIGIPSAGKLFLADEIVRTLTSNQKNYSKG